MLYDLSVREEHEAWVRAVRSMLTEDDLRLECDLEERAGTLEFVKPTQEDKNIAESSEITPQLKKARRL